MQPVICRSSVRWGIQWRSDNWLDGATSHLITDSWRDGNLPSRATGLPILFNTRQEARDWRNIQYGYIRHRPDLRAEPHGWKMPRVVKVQIDYSITGVD